MVDCEEDPLPDVADLSKIEVGLYLVNDMANEDLLSHFEEAVAFIDDGQKKGNVLVHCYFGVSRSATLVTCYLMKKYKMSVDEALQRVKSRRRCVGPNSGFLGQLLLYQMMGWNLVENNLQYRLYRLKAAAASMVICGKKDMDEKFQNLVQQDPRLHSNYNFVAYKCRTCRSPLINQDFILPHCHGETPVWSDSKWSGAANNLHTCDEGIFTLPISWMKEVTSTLQGKLFCPKCQAKVGTYNWCAGCDCPCGAKIIPGFYFIPSKIDKCM
ncbi:dual specificity protein phosphatase MPK-4-like isoform X2 [Homarus americanus]|uniref:dual specificity protein phosphatase MPK-4-like isoform X2 n=1 Tax=Homarus americanus TaxID=6706 RepID=UPI001C484475|nr:dual specificity protein phosphatase MPK-4-like isoform X2 [Homarus americanus]XP_042242892.1 dual specificity protein phosphatase MPK-4-like isoform X2 [Homarus americanus]XP_042242894.1 dual specificity protein phosphatase MPK-4-like isoform X2 [Homarus americanus]XP_042242895.1 dual specificity protein phosphatase MPK-4-like isoform X2 [Homarus americanus]